MIVELLGPPGAGKSSLLPLAVDAVARWSGRACLPAGEALDGRLRRSRAGRLLAPLLGRRPRRLRAVVVDLPFGLAVVVEHPRLALAAARAILRAPVGWGHRRTLLARWIGVAARQRFLRDRLGDEIAVFDEGIYHRSVNLFAWRRSSLHGSARLREDLRAYLRAAPAPDLAIFVDAADDLIAARLAARGLPIRLRSVTPARAVAFLAAAGEIARAVPDETADCARWLRIENGSILEEAGRQIETQLRRLRPEPSGDRRWPITGGRLLPFPRRPDRWLRGRPRRLDAAERRIMLAVAADLGLRDVGGLRTVGAGRSWNVVMETGRGRLLVKRYKPTVEDAAIASEHAVLGQLAALELPAPRLVAARDGRTVVHRDGASFAAFHRAAGRIPMHELISSRGERRKQVTAAGAALAILHEALAGIQPEAYPGTGLGPDGARLQPVARLAEQLRSTATAVSASPSAAEAFADRLCRLDARLAAASLGTTLVHGDYGPYNLLLRPGEPLLVIDFELARLDWRLLDLVTALPRFSTSRAAFSAERFDAFLAGYLEIAPAMRAQLVHGPALLELLALRRAAVLLARNAEATDRAALREAAARLKAARAVADGRDRLAAHFAEASR